MIYGNVTELCVFISILTNDRLVNHSLKNLDIYSELHSLSFLPSFTSFLPISP